MEEIEQAPHEPPARRTRLWIGPAIIFGALAFVVFAERMGFAHGPPCLLRQLTGLNCPGCGGTRAFFALSHGEIAKSIRFNPWTLILVTGLGIWGVKRLIRAVFPDSRLGRPLQLRASWLWGLLVVIVAFGVLRNLPWWPFTWLAPPT